MFRQLLTLVAGVAAPACFRQAAGAAAQERLQVSPFPQLIRYSHHNDDFTVRARTPAAHGPPGRRRELFAQWIKEVFPPITQFLTETYYNKKGEYK